MQDFHRFMRELITLRRRQPALRSEGVATIAMDDYNRVLVFQRYIPGTDVMVIAGLNEFTLRIPHSVPGIELLVGSIQ